MNETPAIQHVDQYYEVPLANKVVESIILILIIVIALVGNISIWIIVLKTKQLRTVTNAFLLGLSSADLLVSAVNIPLTVFTIISGGWVLSASACVASGFLNMVTLVTSVLSLGNISINRYVMVCRPAKFKSIYTPCHSAVMIAVVISVALLLSSPPLFGWAEYSYIPIQSFCFCDWSMDSSYAYFMIAACFGGPLSVMSVCNVFIFKEVRQSRRRVKTVVAPQSSVDSGHSLIVKTNPSADSQNNVKHVNNLEAPKDSHLLYPTWPRPTREESENDMFNSNAPPKSPSSVQDVRFRVENSQDSISNVSSISAQGSRVKRERSKVESKRRREEVRLAISLAVVVVCFVICWFPYCVSMLLGIYVPGYVSREFHMFTLIVGYANSGCNPIIYGVMNKRFGKGFRELYCSWKTQSSDLDTATTSL